MNDARDLIFIMLFVLVPAIALVALWLSGISLRRFSIPSLFIIFYFVFSYFGILPLYFGWDQYSLTLFVDNRATLFKLFLCSSATLVLVNGGFLYARGVMGLRQEPRDPELAPATRVQLAWALVLFIVCCLVFIAYIGQLNEIALVRALSGDTSGAALARSEMGNAFAGKYWRYRLFFRVFMDYIVVFFLADYLVTRRASSGFAFVVSFLAAVTTAIVAIEKGPLLFLLFMLYLTYVLYKGGRYWQPGAKYFAVAIVGVVSVLYIRFMGTPSFGAALQYFTDRVLIGQVRPAYYYLHIFPNYMDYLWGRSLPNPRGILPFEPFALSVEVERFMWPHTAASGVIGSAPTVFWAEMYANFGIVGVLGSSFFVGIGLVFVAHLLARRRLTPPVCAATVTLAMHYMTLTATGLSNYLVDTTLVGITLVTLILLRPEKMMARRRRTTASVAAVLAH